MEPTDDELLRRLARGDEDSLGALYDRHADGLLGLALKLLRDRQEAEDAVHDLFVEVWQRAGEYDPRRASVRTWIAMRLRSRCLDRLRRAKLRRDKTPEPVATAERPEAIERAADEPTVRAALAALGEPQREVVLLCYFGGLTSTEIAERLSIPSGTVKSRLRSALMTLRSALEPTGARS